MASIIKEIGKYIENEFPKTKVGRFLSLNRDIISQNSIIEAAKNDLSLIHDGKHSICQILDDTAKNKEDKDRRLCAYVSYLVHVIKKAEQEVLLITKQIYHIFEK